MGRSQDLSIFLSIAIHDSSQKCERYGHISEVHVKKEYQGVGLATHMLEYTIEELKKWDVNVVYIDTGGDNAKAIHLYEKMGL